MVKLVDKQSAFNTGIITNKLKGRDDLKQYATGVADSLNFIASKYGPMIKRTGTLFKRDVGHAGEEVFLLPFVLSVRQTVILEFLPYRIRFYTFNGEDFGPIADPNNPSIPYELSTTYSASVIKGMSYVTSLDVIYIAFSDGATPPVELRRYANNNWAITPYTYEDGPYLDQNYDASKTVQVDDTTIGLHTLTVSGFTLNSSDIGRHVRINHIDDNTLEDRWGWGVITSITGSNTATIDMKQKVWSTGTTTDFRLGAWGAGQGYPTLVSVHGQRLVWAGTTNYPWLWMSNSFNYHNFSPSDFSGDIKASNAIYYNMSTDKIAPVRWMASLGSLIIGTELYEMRMYSSGAGLSPGDCVVRKESTYGVHDALPIITDDTCIFVQRLQRKLRSMAYDYTRDAYVGPELSVLSESLTVEGITKIVHQREPNDLIWCLMGDGKLLAVTYDKEQAVIAWSRVELAGKNAKVIDMAVVPSATFKQDMLILWVERIINGSIVRYAEILSRELQDNMAVKRVSYLDSSMRYQGSSTTTITGLTHLIGETVRVMDRGGLHEDVTVDENGTVTMLRPIEDGWIGLPYESYFETLERDFSDKQISTKMARVRIHRLVLYLLRTLGLKVTQLTRGMQTQLITFDPHCHMDTPPEPVSGEFEHDVMTAWTNVDMSYSLHFYSEPGLPCTVAGIYTGVEVNAL